MYSIRILKAWKKIIVLPATFLQTPLWVRVYNMRVPTLDNRIDTSSFFIMRRRRFCGSEYGTTAGATGRKNMNAGRIFFFIFFDYCYFITLCRLRTRVQRSAISACCCGGGFSFIFFSSSYSSSPHAVIHLIRTSSPPSASTTTYRYLPCAVTRWCLQMYACHACGQKVYNVYTRRFVIIDDEIADALTEPRAGKTLKRTRKLSFTMLIAHTVITLFSKLLYGIVIVVPHRINGFIIFF